MKNFYRFIFVISFSCFFPGQVFAYGDQGHQVVASIAWMHLSESSKTQIQNLLNNDKDSLTDPDFVSRATWADKFRDSDRNTTKLHYNATHKWHFVDLSLSHPDLASACSLRTNITAAHLASQGETEDCVVDKIEQFSAELKNPATPSAEKIVALKFILHFVGDIHQPLHAEDNHDEGGNQLTVRFTNQQTQRSKTSNLHPLWLNG